MSDEDEIEEENEDDVKNDVEAVWDDEARATLRETLERLIHGELRMAKSSLDQILQTCCEVYIHDTCPEDEWETFDQFAAKTLRRTADRGGRTGRVARRD